MTDQIRHSAIRSIHARRRIEPMIYQTPLLPSRVLGGKKGCDLWFKAENFQVTGSFKMRGAASKLTALEQGRKLIAASSGNHGIASARAASLTGHDLTVVVPETVSVKKLAMIRSFGVRVILHGSDPGMAETHAQELATTEGYFYVAPYNDWDVIAGQGTIGLELLEQASQIDNVFIAMGGGGLISGIGSVLKSLGDGPRVFGVSARNSAALAASLAAGHVVETEHLDTIADGVAGALDAESITLSLASNVIDQVLVCNEDEIVSALQSLAMKENMLVEGAAALALAGFLQVSEQLKGQSSVILLCGSNFDEEKILALITN